MTPSTKCPKCGSSAIKEFDGFTEFACRSHTGFVAGDFTQTTICERKVELATLRTALDKAKEERDAKDEALKTALAEVRRLHAAYPGIGKDLSEWVRHHDSCDKAGVRANKLRRPVYCTCGLDNARRASAVLKEI